MKKNRHNMAKWLNVATLATMIPVSTGVGFIIGYYLDKLFKTEPYLVIIWTLLGIIAGFKSIIEFVIRENKEIEEESDKKD